MYSKYEDRCAQETRDDSDNHVAEANVIDYVVCNDPNRIRSTLAVRLSIEC
jgi:hypothetical protein